jgi:hypothetical protein
MKHEYSLELHRFSILRGSCRHAAAVNEVCNYTKVPPERVINVNSPLPAPVSAYEDCVRNGCTTRSTCGNRTISAPLEFTGQTGPADATGS